jgi:hypothetical protein
VTQPLPHEKMNTFFPRLNGWLRLWCVLGLVSIIGAVWLALSERDYNGDLHSASCIPFTQNMPFAQNSIIEKSDASKDAQIDFSGISSEPDQFSDVPPLILDSCTTWKRLVRYLFASAVLALSILMVGYLFVWVKQGFQKNDV